MNKETYNEMLEELKPFTEIREIEGIQTRILTVESEKKWLKLKGAILIHKGVEMVIILKSSSNTRKFPFLYNELEDKLNQFYSYRGYIKSLQGKKKVENKNEINTEDILKNM